MSHGHAWEKPVAKSRVDLSVRIGSLTLRNPILTASGTFGYAREMAGLVDLARLGGIVPKTITAQPRAGNAPWRTIETPHFRINYHLDEERLAQRLAVAAEAAHRKLAPLLDHEPRFKTEIVLSDDSDDANGSATVQPLRVIHLFATAPDNRSELNDYDEWLTALVTHEYTHILHLDTIHGVARIINAVLGFGERGQLYAPNQSQPRFLIEGLAVFEETERTSGGRLRSTIFDMYLRMASLEGKLQRLDQFSNYPIQWPRGNSPYLYGSAFLRYIASLYGQDVFRRLSHEYGGSWLPGGINRALLRVTGGKGQGKTFADLYAGFRASMDERYRAQRAAVDARGRIEGTPLTTPREYIARPMFTPDGKHVIWSDYEGTSRPRFRRVPVEGGKPDTAYLVDAAGDGALSRDGRKLYFGAVEVFRTQYYWNDLFVADLATGEKTRLTEGLRASEPDLSPDGKTLAFEVNEVGVRSLVTMPAAGGPGAKIRRLVGNRDDFSQIYTPVWSPDGKTIAFSWWREGGYRDIWTVDVESGELRRLTADHALDLDPRFSPDGKYLYFASDRTGIFNLFAREIETGKTWQATDVLGGVFSPAISPDGRTCVYVGFAADGYRLERVALDPARFRPAPEALLDRPESDPLRVDKPLASRPYNPWRTMAPWTWSGTSYPDAFGQVFALTLSGGDVVGFHDWNLSVGFGTGRADDIPVSIGYTYSRLFPALSVSAYRALTRRGGFFIDGINRAYNEEDWSASAGVALPILRRIDKAADLSFNYNLVWLRNLDRDKLPLNPNQITPHLPETGRVASLGVNFSYNNLRRFTFSVSTALGRALSLNLGFSNKVLGSEYNAVTASWRYVEYLPGLFTNHTLALGYAGGISGGDVKRRATFALGGYAPQPDFVRAFFDFTRPGGANLRGYAFSSIYGPQFHVLNAEYRFPIWWIERGYDTFPIYLRRLHGAVFADFGGAFSAFDPKLLKLGVGAEVRLELYLFWYFPAALQLGYAHGFMEGGENQVYFLLNNPF